MDTTTELIARPGAAVRAPRTAQTQQTPQVRKPQREGTARHRAPRRETLRRDAWIVGALVLAVVAVVTLGKPFIEIPGVIDASAHHVRRLNLQLFNDWNSPSVWYGPYTNTFGNIALFMPVGAVLYAIGQTNPRWRFGLGGTVLLALALSLGIEATQYVFALGYSDIDDLWTNTLGAAFAGILFSHIGAEQRAKILHRLGFLGAAVLTVLAVGLGTGVLGTLEI